MKNEMIVPTSPTKLTPIPTVCRSFTQPSDMTHMSVSCKLTPMYGVLKIAPLLALGDKMAVICVVLVSTQNFMHAVPLVMIAKACREACVWFWLFCQL